MTWKLVSEDKGFGGAPFCDAFNRRFSAREDTKYRVTVEEEVSDCCEKWRGCPLARWNGHWAEYDIPAFYPECGARLS
jgi:hypothetical protein